jgi:hypothetical protein
MTVLPQPNAPGMAVVPPCTHLNINDLLLLEGSIITKQQ